MSNPDFAQVVAAFPSISLVKQFPLSGQRYVYLAKKGNGEQIIVKLLDQSSNVERFNREIKAVKVLDSSNVPAIYEFGQKNVGNDIYHYLVEEFVDGEDLQSRLDKGNRLNLEQVVLLVETILNICVSAEEANPAIVHRDIKPGNVVLDNHGNFWLIDFGISRHLGLVSVTATAAQLGPHSPGYSAPEQFRNLKRDIDTRADLFSLGVTAIVMISGSNPFINGANNPLTILRNTETVTLSLLNIPGDTQNQFAAYLNNLADKHISRRPRTAKEALRWLTAIKPTLKI